MTLSSLFALDILHKILICWRGRKHTYKQINIVASLTLETEKTLSFSASDVSDDNLHSLKMSLMRKVNLADGKTEWECVQCGRRHYNKSNILQHVDTHIEGVKYICDFCQKHFKSQGSLNVHVTLKHREEKRKVKQYY